MSAPGQDPLTASQIAQLQNTVSNLQAQNSALSQRILTVQQTPSTSSSTTTENDAPYWVGTALVLPYPGSTPPAPTNLPVTGSPSYADPTVDWDPTFDAVTPPANGRYTANCPTASGEFMGAFLYGDYGDIRHTINVQCKQPTNVPANLQFISTSTFITNASVQVKLNGAIIGAYTEPVVPNIGALFFMNITIPFQAGPNRLSIARCYGTQALFLSCSFINSGCTWINQNS